MRRNDATLCRGAGRPPCEEAPHDRPQLPNQITYQEQGEAVTDVDVVRAPSLVLQCTAATTAAVGGKPADPCGIQPDVMPSAPYYGILTATDSHSVNKLVSKWISASVDKKNKYSYATAGDSVKPLPLPVLPLADTPAGMRSTTAPASGGYAGQMRRAWPHSRR